jgi:ribonuclease T1
MDISRSWIGWLLPLLVPLMTGIVHARAPLPAADEVSIQALPSEARETLALIKRGGPFPYPKDGAIFGNYERRLPIRPRGYYREYTVRTPGSRDRGARRIVAGAGAGADVKTSNEYYYTADHYRSFKRIVE